MGSPISSSRSANATHASICERVRTKMCQQHDMEIGCNYHVRTRTRSCPISITYRRSCRKMLLRRSSHIIEGAFGEHSRNG